MIPMFRKRSFERLICLFARCLTLQCCVASTIYPIQDVSSLFAQPRKSKDGEKTTPEYSL